jgi:succinoglycan biosynthesis protein ExoA
VVREHPKTASFRYLAPPGAAALIGVGLAAGAAGLAGLAAGAPAGVVVLTAGLVIPLTYAAGVTAVSAALSRDLPLGVRARLPLVLGVMHLCWGAGFLASPRRLHQAHDPDTSVRPDDRSAQGVAPAGRE